MPDYTGNLNLAKPIPNEDSADIRVINENMDKIDEWSTEINKKTKGATSEAAGIVKYGTDVSTALEGSKLAEILGIEYGGVLNNNNQKVAGKGYYDTANKKIYKCTTNTSINYADAAYFIEVSNNDLLGKLQNLYRVPLVSLNRYLGSSAQGIGFGETIVTLDKDLFEYSSLEFHFVTPGDDGTRSIGVYSSPMNHRFAVSAIGSYDGTQNNRKQYSVVFYYNNSTRELKLGFSAEKPEVHLMGIFGYKII